MITQKLLSQILQAERFYDEGKALVKKLLEEKDTVEPGHYYAYISAESKRTPKYKDFIMSEHGPAKVHELMNNTKPTNYVKLCIGINEKEK